MATRALVFSFLFLIAAPAFGIEDQYESIDASIRALASEGEKLDGQRVRVHGWIEIEPETFRLWANEGAMKNGGPSDECVGVVLPDGFDRRKFDTAYVVVSGLYVSDVAGKYVVLGGCRERRFIFIDKVEFAEDCDKVDHSRSK